MSGYNSTDPEYRNKGYYAERDIFDDRGVLLLRKGQAISDDIIEKLKRHGIKDVNILEWNTKSLYQIRNIQKTQIIQNIHNRVIDLVSTRLEKRLNVCDTVIFEKASKMLKTIIFENKSEPWWVYINTLANYIG